MNILPHKSWHVRTKANIARVRRDEAKSVEEEKVRQNRIELAEKEARTNLLRERARAKYDGRNYSDSELLVKSEPIKHINFFEDLEKGEADVVKGNKEYEREKKEEQEKYEKQIGYLTYLGQDTVEATGKVSWFNKLPERLTSKDNTEVNADKKALLDPVNKLKFFLKKREADKEQSTKIEPVRIVLKKKVKNINKKRKHTSNNKDTTTNAKKHKVSSSSSKVTKEFESKVDLDDLRAKRLKRELEEKERADKLLAKLRGEIVQTKEKVVVTQKYNSQFNPHLAKQNFSNL